MIKKKITICIGLIIFCIGLSGCTDDEVRTLYSGKYDGLLGASLGSEIQTERTWNSNKYIQPNGDEATVLAVGWVNYLEDDGTWQSINTDFVETSEFFTVEDAPFIVQVPKYANGEAKFINNNRWDIFDKTEITDNDFIQTIKALNARRIGGQLEIGDLGFGETNYVIYRNAFSRPSADLIYWVHHGESPRLRKIIRFNSKPTRLTSDLRYEFEITYSDNSIVKEDGIEWSESGILTTTGKLSHKPTTATGRRGISFQDFYIWDSGVRDQRQYQLINIEYQNLYLNKYKLIKIIPKSFLDSATYPVYTDTTSTFYPDADQSSSQDGWVVYQYGSGSGVAWATLRNNVTGSGTGGEENPFSFMWMLSDSNSPNWRTIGRSLFGFDISSIGDDTIDSATLSLYGDYKKDDLDATPDVNVYSVAPVSNTSMSTDDYDAFGITAYSTAITYANYDTTDYNDFVLNAAGITYLESELADDGIANMGTRNANHDVANSAPVHISSKQSQFNCYFSEEAGTTKDPKLVVVHSAGNTCTAPVTGDWYIDSKDSCYVTSDTYVIGEIHLLNRCDGALYIIDGATLSAEKINSTSTPINVEQGSFIKLWTAT